ncbi:hypothetical protein E8E13_001538 [Curvularia kusanoi]|uniref:Uncharacterized protein n=1 Tax=Curvularia kusanoi TaxID=90978 RepID=A0A9P4T5N5_CURKU|nr:hypothetical protein E8E13_001538 [Curvularia kusanoi]
MASSSNKRPAPDTTPAFARKRQRRSQLASINIFEVSVFTEDKFDRYPETLRVAMETHHENLMRIIMAKFQHGLPLTPTYEYTVTSKKSSQPKDAKNDYQVLRSDRYPAASLANQAILENFLSKAPSRKLGYTELKVGRSMANPTFAQLHSVRNGDMGWGFDRYGCLSLHLTKIEDGCLKHEALWVERVNPAKVKVEEPEDDECCVVGWRQCEKGT